MTFLAFLGLVPALFSSPYRSAGDDQVVRRVVVQDEVIFRIPIRPRRLAADRMDGEERAQMRSTADTLAGAMLSGPVFDRLSC